MINVNARPIIQNRIVDAVNARKYVKYLENGLTYVSNNTAIHPRDSAGNIILHENSESNPLLIIEPTAKKISNKSMLRMLDTTFQYYTFPVTTDTIEDVPELNLDLDLTTDTVSTRLIIPYQEYPAGVPNSYRRLNLSYENVWFTNNRPGESAPGGFLKLPFTGGTQLEPGTFTITPDILDLLINENKTIKFKIQMVGTPVDASQNTGFSMRLRRDNSSAYRDWIMPTLYTQTKGNYNAGDYPFLKMEYILTPTDLVNYDKFYVEAVAGNASFYIGDSTIWDIELIDNDPALFINSIDGITYISPNMDLRINNEVVISGEQ